jgi:integrase
MLDATPRVCPVIVTTSEGRPWGTNSFQVGWARACRRVGVVGLTFHDLRCTAITRLALAGCTEAEIAAISGHSLRSVHAILDSHYLSRDPALGETAIRKLEKGTDFSNRTSN